jgi:hypothetical protein
MPHEKELLTCVAEDTGATLSQWARKTLLEAAGGWKDREQIVSPEKPEKDSSGLVDLK